MCRHWIHLTITSLKELTVLWSEEKSEQLEHNVTSDMADIRRTEKSILGVHRRELKGGEIQGKLYLWS